MPSWQARHALQLLADAAPLKLTVTQWPLPANAVWQALIETPVDGNLAEAKQTVLYELDQLERQGRVRVHARTQLEGFTGFGENYTPGSSIEFRTSDFGGSFETFGYGLRLGAKLEQSSNSLYSESEGIGTNKTYQFRPEGSAAVLSLFGWNLQATSQRYWWGPGWQSSMINGSNNPTWSGLGIQRASTAPSTNRWFAWIGPWNLDLFVAKAQDPMVAQEQPLGFLYSAARLTIKPDSRIEVGFSRAMQIGGKGRPSGVTTLVKSFFGQEVNQEPGDPPDTSSQIAGYDIRVVCPKAVNKLFGGHCAAYTQWMGEDAAGRIPLPYKFMSLWGIENTYSEGRYRAYIEYLDSNAFSLPWDTNPTFPGYLNSKYPQGYTQGSRWVGPSVGSGSRFSTLGWMDSESQTVFRLHWGTLGATLGAFSPLHQGPLGKARGVSIIRKLDKQQGVVLTPEFSYTQISSGQDLYRNRRNNLRLGLSIQLQIL